MANKCDIDREELDKLFDLFIQKHGHEAVKDLYNIHRFTRNYVCSNRFPFRIFYRRSLGVAIETEYRELNAREIADKEGMPRTTINRILMEYYRNKRGKRTKATNDE